MEEMDYSNTSTELNNFFGINDPKFMLGIIGLYLLTIFKIAPSYMKDRPAYQFTKFLVVYNVGQVLVCFYVLVAIWNLTSAQVLSFWKCKLFEQNTKEEYVFNRIAYVIFWLKIAELTETVVFVLRKKQNQVSALHVFHHCSTITLVYILFKLTTGGSALYPLFLNTFVHIIMYSYYLAAAVCSKETSRRLLPIKKSITTMQMIQFCLILTQAFILRLRCSFPNFVICYYVFVVSVVFYGFYDFYQKSYNARVVKSSKS